VPTVSEGRSQPNLEKILELKPDLVIGAAGFHDQTLAKLNSLGVPTLTTKVDRWQDLEALTRELATAVQADPTLLLKDYQTLLPATPVAKPSTLVLVSRQPLLSPNKASWAGDLLARFGANNLATNLQGQSPMQGYITLSPEKVLEADPEVLILVDVGDGEIQKLKAEPFWNQLKATKSNQVYVFDYYGLVNPGSVETIAQASKKLKQVFAAQ
jgi:iron complex transport system substrate-binding protein